MKKWSLLAILLAASGLLHGDESKKTPPKDGQPVELGPGDAQRGYELLTRKAYLPPVFTQDNMDEIWRVWPKSLRARAKKAGPELRRQMIFERYGFTERVDFETGLPDGSGKPLQYVVDERGRWSMNCLACHGGSVMGKSYPGAPNNRFAFELLAKEMRTSKLRRGIPPSRFDVGSMLIPLGESRGTTNAIMFGMAFLHYRDEDLNLVSGLLPPALTHHDVDAPPWWTFNKKERLYIDGFAEKSHRGLLQFVMIEENSGDMLRSWEAEFNDIYAYLSSIKKPKYPLKIDLNLAQKGAAIFQDNCSHCHGTYRSQASPNDIESYTEYRISIEEIGTDPVRLSALSSAHRAKHGRSWLAHYGNEDTVLEPAGYVAPPLDGIWASAPYLHNGSVPSLWGVLNPTERPTVWQHQMELDGKTDLNFDATEVGLAYREVSDEQAGENVEAQEFFDSRKFGKSNQGHTYPDQLSRQDKLSVFEYLKTL